MSVPQIIKRNLNKSSNSNCLKVNTKPQLISTLNKSNKLIKDKTLWPPYPKINFLLVKAKEFSTKVSPNRGINTKVSLGFFYENRQNIA